MKTPEMTIEVPDEEVLWLNTVGEFSAKQIAKIVGCRSQRQVYHAIRQARRHANVAVADEPGSLAEEYTPAPT